MTERDRGQEPAGSQAASGADPGRLSRARDGIVAAGKGAGQAGAHVVKGFWSGFSYPMRGARFVYLDNPGLVRIWIWPLLATAMRAARC